MFRRKFKIIVLFLIQIISNEAVPGENLQYPPTVCGLLKKVLLGFGNQVKTGKAYEQCLYSHLLALSVPLHEEFVT